MRGTPTRVVGRLALAGAAATAVQFMRARTGYPWFGDLDPSGDFGDPAKLPVDLLLVGDSSCTGSGLADPADIWVRQLMPRFAERYHVRLVSLAAGGAQVADVIRDQLPQATRRQWDVVFVSVGANDVLRSPSLAVTRRWLSGLVEGLLTHARIVVLSGAGDMGTSPRMLPPFNWMMRHRSRQLDRVHASVAAGRERVRKVDMWAHVGAWRSRDDIWAGDGFHPNRAGHALWAEAIYPALAAAIDDAVAMREAG